MKNNIKKGEELIYIIYDNFKSYFELGDIIVDGSYFYRLLNLPINITYKDIDLVVDSDKSKDYIVEEIFDFFRNSKYKYDTEVSFIKRFDSGLNACLVFDDYPPIDILRSDFTNNGSSIEILPGVYSKHQSTENLTEIYNKHLKNININNIMDNDRKEYYISLSEKFTLLRDFYKSNPNLSKLITEFKEK